ncbi:TPA: hypothetical protein ACFI97_001521 [Neisseria gonorrhoeae]
MKKTSKYLIYTAAFTSFCFAFQENRSEAKQPDITLSASLCEQFNMLNAKDMDTEQVSLSKECDIIESSHDWEKEYGNLNEQEMLAGVAYE